MIPEGLVETPFSHRFADRVIAWDDVLGFASPLTLGDPDGEYEAVRNGVAVTDYSVLCKWHVQGVGAVDAVNRVFTRDVADQVEGKMYYGAFTEVDASMVEDVTVTVLGPEHLLVVGANKRSLALLQEAAPHTVSITDMRDTLAVATIQGPRSRELLARLTDADVSGESFPYYSSRSMTVAGIPARVSRVGFTAELGYEIDIPRESADVLWDALELHGHELGLRVFGWDALMRCRTEAGMVIDGFEYDSSVSPFECRLGWTVDFEKRDFPAREALLAAKSTARGRVVSVELDAEPADGFKLWTNDQEVGWVTMAVASPYLDGRTLGLARISAQWAQVGMELDAVRDGVKARATIVATPVYDPERKRVRS